MANKVDDIHRNVIRFFKALGLEGRLPETAEKLSLLSDLIRCHIRIQRLERGRLTCAFTVGGVSVNVFNTLHGGALVTAAEEIARACVRTVADDKELFLGEGSATYLYPARIAVQQSAKVISCSPRFGSPFKRHIHHGIRPLPARISLYIKTLNRKQS